MALTGTLRRAGRYGGLAARRLRGRSVPVRPLLRARDWLRDLKIDASQVNLYYLDDLLALFPDSRFVLTVRPPAAWLRSLIDHTTANPLNEIWHRYRTMRFATGAPVPAEEAALAARGLFPLRGYLGHWRDGIDRVLQTVPADRLLVVETRDLGPRSAEIAAFCGIPGGAVPAGRSRANVGTHRTGALETLPEGYLETVLAETCGPLAARLFPGRPLIETGEGGA